MVKRPDNAIAEIDIFMEDGRYAFNLHCRVADLRDWWKTHKQQIRWICFDIGLTTYFWSPSKGWQKTSRWHYNGGHRKPTVITRKQYLAEMQDIIVAE